jgi:hypothetical protein
MTNICSGEVMEGGSLSAMSDQELVAGLVELLREERRVTAAVLVHLGEVEARKLYLLAACSSMHGYCTRVLGMSDDEAFKRILRRGRCGGIRRSARRSRPGGST